MKNGPGIIIGSGIERHSMGFKNEPGIIEEQSQSADYVIQKMARYNRSVGH